MRTFRIVAVVAVLLLAGQAVGLNHLVPVDECARDCAPKQQDQGSDPDCDTCACCPSTRLAVATAPPLTRDHLPRIAAPPESSRPPASPEPADIAHVPKSLA